MTPCGELTTTLIWGKQLLYHEQEHRLRTLDVCQAGWVATALKIGGQSLRTEGTRWIIFRWRSMPSPVSPIVCRLDNWQLSISLSSKFIHQSWPSSYLNFKLEWNSSPGSYRRHSDKPCLREKTQRSALSRSIGKQADIFCSPSLRLFLSKPCYRITFIPLKIGVNRTKNDQYLIALAFIN